MAALPSMRPLIAINSLSANDIYYENDPAHKKRNLSGGNGRLGPEAEPSRLWHQFAALPVTPLVVFEVAFAGSFGRSALVALPARHISESPMAFSSFVSCTW